MIFTNFKLKIRTKQRGYDQDYAWRYLDKRKRDIKTSKNEFEKIITEYKIPVKGNSVLDLASGVGVDLKILGELGAKKRFWHDKMEGPSNVAKKYLFDQKNIQYRIADLMDLELYPPNSMSFVICRDSICYAGNDYLFFSHIKRILKPGGFFWGRNNSFDSYHKKISELNSFREIIKYIRRLTLDWPLYILTGLRIFSFLPASDNRLKKLFNKLNLEILFFKKNNGKIEFLIQNN